MDDQAALEIMLMTQARADTQRIVLKMILRRLKQDVPDFSFDLLSDQLHGFLENAPQPKTAVNERQALMAEIANEELREVIAMVEDVIKGEPDPE